MSNQEYRDLITKNQNYAIYSLLGILLAVLITKTYHYLTGLIIWVISVIISIYFSYKANKYLSSYSKSVEEEINRIRGKK